MVSVHNPSLRSFRQCPTCSRKILAYLSLYRFKVKPKVKFKVFSAFTGKTIHSVGNLRGQRVRIFRVCRRLLNSFTRNRRFELGLLRSTTWSVYFTRPQIRRPTALRFLRKERNMSPAVSKCASPSARTFLAERRSFPIFTRSE